MKINGIPASDGISICKVLVYVNEPLLVVDELSSTPEKELENLYSAVEKSKLDLAKIKQVILEKLDVEHAMIFDAHIQICNDQELIGQSTTMIEKGSNAAYAYHTVAENFAAIFESMDNAYMKERAADVRDVARRVVGYLLNKPRKDLSIINEKVILAADDLTPSDTAQLNTDFVKGFITNIGGRTSHSAIMARSLEIPAVVGTHNVLDLVNDGDTLILNGLEGYAILNPTENEIEEHNKVLREYLHQTKFLNQFINKPSITKDGSHVEIAANIGSEEDLDAVLKYGAEGIGLFRTEFLYMNSNTYPTEEEQFNVYKKVLEAMDDKKVVIRTLDIGGDKNLEYLQMDEELNPFLGHRALRLCLDNHPLFKTQLRALLRASVYGNLHIMFPMVAVIDELRDAKALLEECKNELVEEDYQVSNNYKVGIMVEIPAVAILADKFAKEVDFFSIGTNDLIQYSFAADRMNQKVSYLYQPYNPSLMRLIKLVIDASHKEGIWTGMCGEVAGDDIAVPLLIGLGLDEFSMSASNILKIRYLVSQLDKFDMKKLAEKALNKSSNEQVKKLVKKHLKSL